MPTGLEKSLGNYYNWRPMIPRDTDPMMDVLLMEHFGMKIRRGRLAPDLTTHMESQMIEWSLQKGEVHPSIRVLNYGYGPGNGIVGG